MNFDNILVEKDGPLGIIKINRQEVRNALDAYTVEEIREALNELRTDEIVQVVVFTGAGEKSFAAGADIAALKERTMLEALLPGMQGLYSEIENFEKPTIAAINGYALGGGCELAMSCDLRIAANHSKLGLPELNLAIIPGAGGTQRMTRLIGRGKAKELIFTGEIINAEEAKEIGLVNKTVPIADLMNAVKELANKMIKKGPLALQLAKVAINTGSEADLRTGLVVEKLAQTILFATEDKNEGVSAFLEKREANFKRK